MLPFRTTLQAKQDIIIPHSDFWNIDATIQFHWFESGRSQPKHAMPSRCTIIEAPHWNQNTKLLEVMHPCLCVSVFTIPETYRKVGEDRHWVSISEDFAPAHHWHCTFGHWWCRSGIWCWYWPSVLFVKGEQTLKSIFFYQPEYFPITF